MHTDEDETNHSTKEIFNFKINKRRKDLFMRKKGCLIYKIKYIKYDDDDDSLAWQIFINVADCLNLMTDFHHKYPDHNGLHSFFKIFHD